MNNPEPTSSIPWGWILGAALVVATVAFAIWWTTPPENTLPEVYSVM